MQQWNGGDNTLSTVRGNDHFGRPVGINSTATRNKTVLKSSPEVCVLFHIMLLRVY